MSILASLKQRTEAIITSGGYERYFEKDGVTYHHIIDPATGYPAENGLISVTIVSADGTLGRWSFHIFVCYGKGQSH
ncbi:MAG: FAD:protein FMN transferase [Coprococcus sp.]